MESDPASNAARFKADDLVKALSADLGLSKSEVNRICKDIDAEVAALRDRSLKDTNYPHVFHARRTARLA